MFFLLEVKWKNTKRGVLPGVEDKLHTATLNTANHYFFLSGEFSIFFFFLSFTKTEVRNRMILRVSGVFVFCSVLPIKYASSVVETLSA